MPDKEYYLINHELGPYSSKEDIEKEIKRLKELDHSNDQVKDAIKELEEYLS